MRKVLLFFTIPFLNVAQVYDHFTIISGECPKQCVIEFVGETEGRFKMINGVYTGVGKIKINWDKDNYCEGEYKEGKCWNGNGKTTYLNGTSFEGEFKEGENWRGDLEQYNYDGKIYFKGNIKSGKYWDGELYVNECGENPIIYTNGARNDRNYYNNSDIIGGTDATTIHLKHDPRTGTGAEDNSYYITLQVGGKETDWLFDTGCEFFTIGKTHWEELNLKRGVDYTDLNICTYSIVANGSRDFERFVLIKNLQIGKYVVKDVVVAISDGESSLLGIDFFNKFFNVKWNMQKKILTLYK